VLWTLFGIPLGLLMLRSASEAVVKTVLGVVVAGFSIWALRRGRAYRLPDDRRAWVFGLTAGVLGGAYGMNGPPLAMYGSLRRWAPANFRATLQGYFLPASAAGMLGYWISGLWTTTVNHLYLLSLPGVAVGIFLGRMINRRLNARQFVVYVHVMLIAIGTVLLVQAL
jgi:uncharacterized protein